MAAHTAAARVLEDGRIELPAEIRRRYGIASGTELTVYESAGALVLLPADVDPIERACGIYAGGPSMAQQLLEDRRRDAERDK